MKVSVIVPVKNGGATLGMCLANLVWQRLEDIELILVDAASEDYSLNIMEDCKENFPDKVKVISLKEGGIGAAKNAGVAAASGDYIGILACDGVPETHMYEVLYNLATEENCDVVAGVSYLEGLSKLLIQTPMDCAGELDAAKRSRLIVTGGDMNVKLFKAELLKDIHFRDESMFGEDEALAQVYMKAKKLGITKEIIHKYIGQPGNNGGPQDGLSIHKNVLAAMEAMGSAMKNFDNYSEVQKSVEFSLLRLFHLDLYNVNNSDRFSSSSKKFYIEELVKLKKKYVQIPLEENDIAMSKFGKEEMQLIAKYK